jgi:Protein of unknown function (DUF1573)
MKPLFVCLIFAFLLTFTADTSAQEVKTTAKPVASVVTMPKATPAPVAKPATASTKKAKKSEKSSKKPDSKGLFEDDFDGDVGIKYIGTEPLPDEELARVKDSDRRDEPTKHPKSAAKPAVKPTAKPAPAVVTPKVTETSTEAAKPATATAVAATPKVMEAKTEQKPAKVTSKSVKKAAEKPVITEESAKIKETKAEMMEAKADVKPAAVVVAPPTKAVEIAKTEMITPVVRPTKAAAKPVNKASARGARMEFETMTIDLGNVKEDAVLERYFEFTNTGTSTLEILDCRGSCGCVQPRAMNTIIAPGEHGQIYVKYTARNKVGPQKPVVTLTTNGTPSTIRLFIETWVEQIPGGVKDTAPVTKSENN